MTKLYGFKIKELPWGESVPDAPWMVRVLMHYFWLCAFHLVPLAWMMGTSGSLRTRIGSESLQRFAWWGYQHRKYRGYSKESWEYFHTKDSSLPEAF